MKFDIHLLGENAKVSTKIGDHTIISGQPESNGGDGSLPSPFDYFLGSIGMCAGFYVQRLCETKNISTEGIALSLEILRTDDGALDGFGIDIQVPETFPERYMNALKVAVNQCAVKATIQNEPIFKVTTSVDGADTAVAV